MTQHEFATAIVLTILVALPCRGNSTPESPAEAYAAASRRINEEHARKPGTTRERDLSARLPKDARAALERLLELPPGPALVEPLQAAGEAALDLDLVEDFDRIRGTLRGIDADAARRIGVALSRPRFVARGQDGLERPWLERFAGVVDAVLDAYDEVFGFEEWSKVPGKKLRIRVRLVEKITTPPHFAPQFPFHSEVDFPVADAARFVSPTPDGKFLLYGLCHELGHVVAMWGAPGHEEDHHAWAHYTGVAIVEHLSNPDYS
jgi:hypothetical protein